MANFNSVQAAARVSQGGSNANVSVAWGTIEITANNAAASTYTFFKLPAGATVVGGWFYGDDLDTNDTEEIELDIGDAGSSTRFLDSGAITGDAVTGIKPEAGILYPLFGTLKDGPYTYTEATDIIATVAVDAATGGTGTLALVMFYTYNDARVSPPTPPL